MSIARNALLALVLSALPALAQDWSRWQSVRLAAMARPRSQWDLAGDRPFRRQAVV